jgi:2-polyprenyl-3-methyl-5-hydroxy-6-metoxy-1,4-benzoquinol methylase
MAAFPQYPLEMMTYTTSGHIPITVGINAVAPLNSTVIAYPVTEIHAVMIQDAVRTSTYASFILSNPTIFEDAIVLDVGCGTGILSLFAARAGAKHVYAVDASDIAMKAKQIVRANGLDGVIRLC